MSEIFFKTEKIGSARRSVWKSTRSAQPGSVSHLPVWLCSACSVQNPFVFIRRKGITKILWMKIKEESWKTCRDRKKSNNLSETIISKSQIDKLITLFSEELCRWKKSVKTQPHGLRNENNENDTQEAWQERSWRAIGWEDDRRRCSHKMKTILSWSTQSSVYHRWRTSSISKMPLPRPHRWLIWPLTLSFFARKWHSVSCAAILSFFFPPREKRECTLASTSEKKLEVHRPPAVVTNRGIVEFLGTAAPSTSSRRTTPSAFGFSSSSRFLQFFLNEP